jgi:hypothetical protein
MRTLATSCSTCGALLAAEQVLYTERGEVICETCTTKAAAAASNERSASNAASLAYGNPLLGVASFFVDPFFVVSAGAIGNCLFTFRRIRADVRYGEFVRHGRRQKVAAVAGAAVAVLSVALRLL